MTRSQAFRCRVPRTCNIRTKECMIKRSLAPHHHGPWDLQHLNKKNTTTRSQTPHCCVLGTCSIGTKEHDDKELVIVMTFRFVALAQKSTCLNPSKKHRREERSLSCNSIALHACSKLFPLFLLTFLKLCNPTPWSH